MSKHSDYGISKMAAGIAASLKGLSTFPSKRHEFLYQISSGQELCRILVSGHAMEDTPPELNDLGISTQIAYNLLKEALGDLLENFIPQARSVQKEMTKIIEERKPVSAEDLEKCEQFFSSLAVAMAM